MKLHLKAFKPNKNYLHFYIFLGKTKCGQIDMKKEDARNFIKILRSSAEVKFTGDWR